MEIKMNFEEMERMISSCKDAEEEIGQIVKEIAKLAETLQDGGLKGEAGTTYYDGIQDVLTPRMNRLKAKFVELQADLKTAVAEMQTAEAETVSEISSN